MNGNIRFGLFLLPFGLDWTQPAPSAGLGPCPHSTKMATNAGNVFQPFSFGNQSTSLLSPPVSLLFSGLFKERFSMSWNALLASVLVHGYTSYGKRMGREEYASCVCNAHQCALAVRFVLFLSSQLASALFSVPTMSD